MNCKNTAQVQILSGLLALILVGCALPPPAALPTPPAAGSYWPTAGWRTAAPAEQGLDAQKLAQMLEAVKQKYLNLHSLLVIRNGYLVSETYYGSYRQDTLHELYSCTKSVVSTLTGIALDQGKIDRVEHPILDFFEGQAFANSGPAKQALTLEDVLTMRSGLDWQEGDPAISALYRSGNWVKFILDKPLVQTPGSTFNYCSGCSHLLSAVIKQTTGQNPNAFASQFLFEPLGITNFRWETDTYGLAIGGWGLQLTPRDMAKLGYLFLRKGQWDGRQIVSASWVENATRSHTATNSSMGYGYQWWTYPSLEGFAALGRDGQTIFVIPKSDLVIVTTAQMDSHERIFQLIEQYIVPAVQ